jgi:hypothetical protein
LSDPFLRAPWAAALLLGVAAGALGAFLYGPRVGVALGAGTGVLLLIGINARRLLALAGVGLVAIPVLYVLHPAPPLSGLGFTYATHYAAAQWVATGAMLCVGAAAMLGAVQLHAALKRSRTHWGDSRQSPSGLRGTPGGDGGIGDEPGSAASQLSRLRDAKGRH